MYKTAITFIYFSIFLSNIIFSERILIKIPTRERPDKFFSTLDKYVELLSGNHKIEFVVSCDTDDISMNNSETILRLKKYKNLFFYFSPRTNKIDAINRDIDKHLDFDVLIASSDDMVPKVENYDEIIINNMKANFPDFDGILNYHDGFYGHQLNTIPIIGKRFYEKFNYIYYPEYWSVCCDVELTIVSRLINKEACFDQVLFQHQHPCHGFKGDALYQYNESSKFYSHDRPLLYKRMAQNFGLNYKNFENNKLPSTYELYDNRVPSVKWSILMCTLDERSNAFEKLFLKLISQIERNNLTSKIEIIFFKDNRDVNVGRKRNLLLDAAKGEYLCFIDDDDDISDFYISSIYKCLESNPDNVSLKGIYKAVGSKPEKFFHSISIKSYSKIGDTYLRYPNHLNAIKSSIAKKYKFPEKNYTEDYDWATQIMKSGELKKEASLKKFVYIYQYDPNRSATLGR
jgi:hypothetical protein